MGEKSKQFDFSDTLIFTGLSCLGAGLFLWFGKAVALSVVGGLVLLIGLYAAGFGARKEK